MLQFQPWTVILILGVCLFGLITAAPNIMPTDARAWLTSNLSFLPHKPVTLGLDLQGGSYVLFEAQMFWTYHLIASISSPSLQEPP